MTTNGLPVVTAPASVSVAQASATAIPGVSVAESGDSSAETFTATLSDTNGVLSATGAGVSGSGTNSLTITGSLAQVNADLATLSDTDPSSAPDTIHVSVTDSFGNSGVAEYRGDGDRPRSR